MAAMRAAPTAAMLARSIFRPPLHAQVSDEIPSNYPSRNGMGRNYSVYVNKLSLTHSSSFFAKLLETCTKSKSARDVCSTHACVLKSQFSDEVFINNRLIDVYGKCGCLKYAQKLFGNMPTRNAFSYNSIIGALVASGSIVEAERVFIAMPESDQCSWNLMISGFAQLRGV